ncbi:MAG: helix-turn-helix transcriptional regulator [Gammaproteobacteria bacterium]|nr:helix-turn-helix transcriptional regulator [Gammaproteobacteria bacterium]MDH5691717.1 helix-turn-helix transcriptional regulator [Gammaproteobacteria bacterium]
MNFYTLSDTAIEAELGKRLRALRLRKNLTQKELAEATQLSINSIKALEKGQAKLSTVIAALRELGALDQLDHFIAEPSVSPLQLHKMQGKKRQRASGERSQQSAPKEDESEW